MDFNALVDEITSRVTAKLDARSGCSVACEAGKTEGKPKLLVMARDHGSECHKVLESPALAERYSVECAALKEWRCDAADYEAVILFDLTVDDMAGLASGICVNKYTETARKALLLGKKLFAIHEGVELYRYAETAPSAYYTRLLEYLVSLQNAGMKICPLVCVEEAVLAGAGSDSAECSAQVDCVRPAETDYTEASVEKRVLTERDLAALYTNSLRAVHVGAKAIITDLAREYASSRGISIIKDGQVKSK